MMRSVHIVLLAVAGLVPASRGLSRVPEPILAPIATYDTGLAANGAEIVSVRDHDGLAVLTNVGGGATGGGSVDIIDLSDPASPQLLNRVSIALPGTPNSAAIHPHHDYFLVVVGTAGEQGRIEARTLADGALLAIAGVGVQPDSIAIAANGQYAVVANEAEGVTVGNSGGDGSLSLVDLRGFNGVRPEPLTVIPIPLPSAAGLPGFSSGRTDDIARVTIDNTPATLEPESIAFSHDSRYAFVTLQENNGVVRLEMATAAINYVGIGMTSHDADLINGGGYLPTQTLTAFREPDGIALERTGRFFVTADEGDTRNALGQSGPRGGRTVSVFDAKTGALIADTGSQIDDAAAAAGVYPDSRSNRGGSEPEGVDLTRERGYDLAAVSLERANAVALIDVTDPRRPRVLGATPVGTGPEGVKFLRRRNRLYALSANEVSGTLSVLEVIFK